MQELFLTDPLYYDVRLQRCYRDNIFGCFLPLFSPFDFSVFLSQHFSVFYGILSKFFPLFLFWHLNFNNIRNLICYFTSRFTGTELISLKGYL